MKRWGDLTEDEQRDWAKANAVCTYCTAGSNVGCFEIDQQVLGQRSLLTKPVVMPVRRYVPPHSERMEDAMIRYYAEHVKWRDGQLDQDELARRCPWCGLLCESPETLVSHETECE